MLINNIKVPCYNCPDRAVGCHGKCESYLAYKAKANEVRDKRIEAHNQENLFASCLSKATRGKLYLGW